MRSILALTVMLALVGCGEGGGSGTGEKGSFVGEGYSIDPPAGWKHAPVDMMGAKGDSFMVETAAGATFRENLVVMKEPAAVNMSVKEYAQESMRVVSTMLTDHEMIEQSDIKLGDQDAVRVVLEHKMGGHTLRLTQYYTVVGNVGWSMGCTTPASDTSKMAPCEDAMKTFRPE